MKKLFPAIFLFLFIASLFGFFASAQAQGLVPCGDTPANPCGFCHLFELVNNIIIFFLIPDGAINNLLPLVPILASLLIAIGGFFMLTSAANPQGLQRGRTIIFTVVVGLLIVYGAWLFIGLFFQAFGVISFQGGLPWNQISCIPGPTVNLVGYDHSLSDPIDPNFCGTKTVGNGIASGMKETLQAEDMWDAGNQTPSSNKITPTIVVLGDDGSSVWGTFTQPSNTVVAQFFNSDQNDGPLDILVDGKVMASAIDSWQQNKWYAEITGLSNTVHEVKVVNAPGNSACDSISGPGQGHILVDFFGIR